MFLKNPKELGKYFCELRNSKGLSASQLAKAIKYPIEYVRSVERGIIWNPGTKPTKRKHHHAGDNIWESLCTYFSIPYDHIVDNSYLKVGKYHPRVLDPEVSKNRFPERSLQEVMVQLFNSTAYRWKDKRIAPTRTYLLKFALAKDYESTKTCPASVLDGSLKSIMEFINAKALNEKQHALRNYKNNVSYFVREARKRGFLPKGNDDLISDFQLGTYPRSGGRGFPANPALRVPKYTLSPDELAQASNLMADIQDYTDFSTDPLRASRRTRKRQNTIRSINGYLLREAGFLVHHLNFRPETLRLKTLVEPDKLFPYIKFLMDSNKKKYAELFDNTFSGVTRNVERHVQDTYILAKYYLKDSEAAAFIKELHSKLDHAEKIRDKETQLVSLKDLERVGESLYPYNRLRLEEGKAGTLTKRVQTLNYMKEHKQFEPCGYGQTDISPGEHLLFSGRRLANRMIFSLIFRLLVRIPLRQRNIREMKLGKNLIRKGDKYIISFKGKQLKVARRGPDVNHLVFTIERDGTGFFELLEEWLTVWRPCLMNVHRRYIRTKRGHSHVRKAKANAADIYHSLTGYYPPDCGEENHDYVFVNMNGMPFAQGSLYASFKAYAYRYLHIPLTPHLVRDCWATEYLIKTREEKGHPDVVGAAEMLGDSIQTVYKYYAHILGEKAQARPKQWLLKYLKGEPKIEGSES